jgi:hypothetical protein
MLISIIYLLVNIIIITIHEMSFVHWCRVLQVIGHEPERLFTHRLKLGFVHPPRLPGDVNRIFRSRTGRHRLFYRSLYAFRHRLHRVNTILPLQLPPSRRISCFETLDDPPHKWESWNHQCTARPKNGAHPGKAIYIQLIGSCVVQTDTPARRNRLPLVPVTSE